MKKLKIKKKNRNNNVDLIALQALITKLFQQNDVANDTDTEEETDDDDFNELERSIENSNNGSNNEDVIKTKDYLEKNQSILQSNMDITHFPTVPPGTPAAFDNPGNDFNNRLVLDPNVVSFHPMNGPMRTFAEHLQPRSFKRSSTRDETPSSSELLKQLQPKVAAREQPGREQPARVHEAQTTQPALNKELITSMIRNFTDPLLTRISKLEQHANDQFTKQTELQTHLHKQHGQIQRMYSYLESNDSKTKEEFITTEQRHANNQQQLQLLCQQLQQLHQQQQQTHSLLLLTQQNKQADNQPTNPPPTTFG
jgi:hypothetical protein